MSEKNTELVALEEPTSALTLTTPSALPSLDRLRHKVEESTAMRGLLIEYVQTNMDAERHFYTIKEGDKPGLSQDGARNLCSLFEVHVSEPELTEQYGEDGHYMCRALVRLVSAATGQEVATGMGSCSTRESRYSHRWLFSNQVPKTYNKAELQTKTTSRKTTMYRVPNPDIADQYNTVLKMAIKRAEVHATLHLPYAAEIFSDTEPETDDEKGLMLTQIGMWARTLKKPVRERASQILWGTAIAQLRDLPLVKITEGFAVLQTMRTQGLNWESETLEDDMRAATKTAGEQAVRDLFGDESTASQPDAPTSDDESNEEDWDPEESARRDAELDAQEREQSEIPLGDAKVPERVQQKV